MYAKIVAFLIEWYITYNIAICYLFLSSFSSRGLNLMPIADSDGRFGRKVPFYRLESVGSPTAEFMIIAIEL